MQRSLTVYTHPPSRDLVSRLLHETRQWEPFETRLWLASQRPGDVVVDVGANLGYFSLLSAHCGAAAAQVFAFEPDAENFRLLRANLAANACETRVNAEQAALDSADGRGALFHSPDNFGDHQIYPGDGERSSAGIPLLAGAAYLQARGVEAIDLLKIDTQGSESRVVQGLLPLLHRSPRLRMLLELTPYSLRLAGSSGAQLLRLLEPLDLPVFIVDHLEHRLVASDYAELTRWCDNVDAMPDDRGFMNIYLGSAPSRLSA